VKGLLLKAFKGTDCTKETAEKACCRQEGIFSCASIELKCLMTLFQTITGTVYE
jgi:hypothetical protein